MGVILNYTKRVWHTEKPKKGLKCRFLWLQHHKNRWTALDAEHSPQQRCPHGPHGARAGLCQQRVIPHSQQRCPAVPHTHSPGPAEPLPTYRGGISAAPALPAGWRWRLHGGLRDTGHEAPRGRVPPAPPMVRPSPRNTGGPGGRYHCRVRGVSALARSVVRVL